jgi:hypothetical protein
MKILTEDAVVICQHVTGKVGFSPQQSWVRVNGRRVLIDSDPENRPIAGCTFQNIPIGILPCKVTRKVDLGYSEFIRIGGKRICLDTVTGKTDGQPVGSVTYNVTAPGQELVEGSA